MHVIQFVKFVCHNHDVLLCLFILYVFCDYYNKYENKLSFLIQLIYLSRQKLYGPTGEALA